MMNTMINNKLNIVGQHALHLGRVFVFMNILICNDLCQGVLNKNHYKLYSIVSEGIQKEPRSISSRHWPL